VTVAELASGVSVAASDGAAAVWVTAATRVSDDVCVAFVDEGVIVLCVTVGLVASD
jgi:hypothetical protein